MSREPTDEELKQFVEEVKGPRPRWQSSLEFRDKEEAHLWVKEVHRGELDSDRPSGTVAAMRADQKVLEHRARKAVNEPEPARSTPMDNETPTLDRALQLLGFMDEKDAAQHLVDNGMTGEDAFLAVKAAGLLAKDLA